MERMILDPIHGHIEPEQGLWQFIDTKHFQRLRKLRQLGTTYWVFPGGTHNRFEHSIGTSHVAECMLDSLRRNQPELKISDEEAFLVKTAALCHDLGHGPFSHAFDNEFIPKVLPNLGFKHEQASTMMLEDLIDKNNIDIEQEDIRFIQALINPSENYCPKYQNKKYLYDIVSNERTSVDVDKFDYIARDCHNVGIPSSFDHSRLIAHCRVINDDICYNAKVSYGLYELFHMRYRLFKEVYTHKTAKAIELMVCDALCEADPVFGLSEIVESRDPERYLTLTDCIIDRIEISTDSRLQKARDLIQRIHIRDLYRHAGSCLVDPPRNITALDITSYCADGSLRPDDILVENLKIDYCKDAHNPVQLVKFFNTSNDTESFHIDSQKVSRVLPSSFRDTHVRVFVKDPAKKKIAAQSFSTFCKKNRFTSLK